MTKKTKPTARDRLNSELLEMAEMYRGTVISHEVADKITKRILGEKSLPKPPKLAPQEIRALRDEARMSQSVFASVLNITTGYLSQLERGAKRPSGPALALLNIIRRKGVEAVL